MMVAAIILAAGGSQRLATPKQLLLYHGTTLIARSVAAAIGSRCYHVIVVLGAYSDLVTSEIGGMRVEIVRNPSWPEGKATSIQAGIRSVSLSQEPCTAVILMTCDQPHVDSDLLNSIIDQHDARPDSIVACEYSGTVGVPALIPRKYFADLMRLTGDEGAKALMVAHPDEIQPISFPEGTIDIDTPQDLETL